ncbi:unnamed protein product [Calypogeia fissa]
MYLAPASGHGASVLAYMMEAAASRNRRWQPTAPIPAMYKVVTILEGNSAPYAALCHLSIYGLLQRGCYLGYEFGNPKPSISPYLFSLVRALHGVSRPGLHSRIPEHVGLL